MRLLQCCMVISNPRFPMCLSKLIQPKVVPGENGKIFAKQKTGSVTYNPM